MCGSSLSRSADSVWYQPLHYLLVAAPWLRLVGPEGLANVHTSFGWSLDLALLSYSLELLTGTLLFVAARMTKLQHSSFE